MNDVGMISIALRTGAPLPQITPCPLLDRFVAYNVHVYGGTGGTGGNGGDGGRGGSGGMDDYGLPRSLTIETLENEQYL